MRVEQESWTIDRLVKSKAEIDLNPVWQRGPTWKLPRQVLLIDSILRGMDIPKVYLRKLPANNPFDYDAVDGQQRLRAIWQFRDDAFALDHPEPLPPIDGHAVKGKKFSQLNPVLRNRFDEFKVSVGEITASKADEIRSLFSRLQMGMSLNSAELRNAMSGPLRYSIDLTARFHQFFLTCRISTDRFKHLDYAAHAFGMAAYQGARDIKAPDLKKMIEEYSSDRGVEILRLGEIVGDALTVLAKVDEQLGHTITQKWIFVDLIWLIMQRQALRKSADPTKLATSFRKFEALRRHYNSKPELLLQEGAHPDVPSPLSQRLYEYIEAFRTQGGTHANLNIRNNALRQFFA